MTKTILLLLAVLLPVWSVTAQNTQEEAPADTVLAEDHVGDASVAALAWLVLVDEAAYGQGWTEAAALFRKAVVQTDWIEQVRAVRKPLGAVLSRELVGGEYTTLLPQAPEGEYVVLQFKTSFKGKVGATETVTPMKDPDGAWRVAGYYIR